MEFESHSGKGGEKEGVKRYLIFLNSPKKSQILPPLGRIQNMPGLPNLSFIVMYFIIYHSEKSQISQTM